MAASKIIYVRYLVEKRDRGGSYWVVLSGRSEAEIESKTWVLRATARLKRFTVRDAPVDITFSEFKSDYVFPTGKYEARSLKDIMRSDPEYLFWLKRHFGPKTDKDIVDAVAFMEAL